jgi:hypothetical protein
MKLIQISALPILLVSFGCGQLQDKDGSGTRLSIAGDWSYDCLEFESNDVTEIRSRRFSFSGANFVETRLIYGRDDSSCETPLQSLTVKGDYEETVLASTPRSGNLDLKLSSVALKLSDENTLEVFNGSLGSTICGGGWVADKERKLTKAECEGNSQNLPYSSLEIFDIYRIEDSRLYLGDIPGELPTVEAQRPKEYAEEAPLARD